MQVLLNKPFTYWHEGITPIVYGPGAVDVPEEVALTAEQCGAVDVPDADHVAKVQHKKP